jgi:hypothetical protein
MVKLSHRLLYAGAALGCVLAAPRAGALQLEVAPGDKADTVVLRIRMSAEEYKAAQGLLGGGKAVVDYRAPGSNEINLRMPMSKQKYEALRQQAATRKGQGPDWCVTCTGAPGTQPSTVRARTSVAASLIGTTQCEESTQSQNNTVTGPGACKKQ